MMKSGMMTCLNRNVGRDEEKAERSDNSCTMDNIGFEW